MSVLTTKRLLHVEDDPMQQRLLAHHLKSIEEFSFETTVAKSEDEAMAAFRSGTFDLVVADYQLAQGNGLHLLGRLRQLDPLIPIIAISGVATAEVAAELVRAGADDYFEKCNLTSAKLARSVRDSFRRADLARRLRSGRASAASADMVEHLLGLCEYFADRVGMELENRLDRFMEEAGRADLKSADIVELYRSVCCRMEAVGRPVPLPAKQVLRPLMLELLVRVSGDAAENVLEELTDHSATPTPLTGTPSRR